MQPVDAREACFLNTIELRLFSRISRKRVEGISKIVIGVKKEKGEVASIFASRGRSLHRVYDTRPDTRHNGSQSVLLKTLTGAWLNNRPLVAVTVPVAVNARVNQTGFSISFLLSQMFLRVLSFVRSFERCGLSHVGELQFSRYVLRMNVLTRRDRLAFPIRKAMHVPFPFRSPFLF